MSDKFEELSKLMDLYNSGAIDKEQMNKLKSQILNPESSSEKDKVEESSIETPKEIPEVKTPATPKIEKEITKEKVTKDVTSNNDKTDKLDALLKEGKISENEHKVLVSKALKLEEIPIPKVEKPKKTTPLMKFTSLWATGHKM